MDLRHLAAEHMERPAIRQWGLKKLAYKIMRVQIQRPKMVILGNWGKRVLSKKQIEYATIDAFVSFEIGRMIYAGEIWEILGRMALWFAVRVSHYLMDLMSVFLSGENDKIVMDVGSNFVVFDIKRWRFIHLTFILYS